MRRCLENRLRCGKVSLLREVQKFVNTKGVLEEHKNMHYISECKAGIFCHNTRSYLYELQSKKCKTR